MSKISDDIRKWLKNNISLGFLDPCSSSVKFMRTIADRIDRELVELPKDAHGEYIRVGDTLDGYGKTIEVVEMRYGRSGWVLISRDGNGYADCAAFTHHHAPTVEDVLREFAYGLGVPVADSYIAASAAKLRLAGGEDA